MIRRFRALVLVSFLVGTGVLAVTTGVASAAVPCTANPAQNVTFTGDIYVPPGANCVLIGSTVQGNVAIHPTGRFSAVNSTILGNVTGSNVGGLNLDNTTVKGNVSITGTSSDSALIGICRSTIGGYVHIRNVFVPNGFIAIGPSCDPAAGNNIAGSVVVAGNTTFAEAPFPGLRVNNNQIGGSLVCFDNNPPASATNNQVKGQTTGECVPVILD